MRRTALLSAPLLMLAMCSPDERDDDPEPTPVTVGGGPSSGGAPSGAIAGASHGGGGALPEYCDCPDIEREYGGPTSDLECFCQTYDCPKIEEIPTDYEVEECRGGVTRYTSPGDYRDRRILLFDGDQLIGLSRRLETGVACGGVIVGAGDTSCFDNSSCPWGMGGAESCPPLVR